MNHHDFGAAVALWSDTLLIGAPKADHSHQVYADNYGTKPNPTTNFQAGYGRPYERSSCSRYSLPIYDKHYHRLLGITRAFAGKRQTGARPVWTFPSIDQDYLVIGAPEKT